MVLAIVQARMQSTRLPGKAMKTINGKPLLGCLLERLSLSKLIDKIIIAAPSSNNNDVLCAYAEELGYEVYRGSEADVLERYFEAATKFQGNTIVRLTADCPLIDPALVDEVIRNFEAHPEYDLVATGLSYPDGLDTEVFSFETLKAAHEQASLPSEREHVTSFIKNSEHFKTMALTLEKDYSFLRLTVDEPVDLELVTEVFAALSSERGAAFSLRDILALYESKPHIFDKNRHIVRNQGYWESVKND